MNRRLRVLIGIAPVAILLSTVAVSTAGARTVAVRDTRGPLPDSDVALPASTTTSTDSKVVPNVSCGKRVYFLMYSASVRPNAAGVSPQPNGCWNWTWVYGSGSSYSICAYDSTHPYPNWYYKQGSGSAPFVYDDTNPNHTSTNENTVIQNCLNGGSTLALEYEAEGGCGAANWANRSTGFTVTLFLRELYCSDSSRDDQTCATAGVSSNHGCVVNVGPDFGNVANLNNDISDACSLLDTYGGPAMGIYMYGYTETTTNAGQINNALNNCFP